MYGMWFDKGFGYHVDNTTGVAVGNDPETIYAVMSGKNFNGGCCFDYGNPRRMITMMAAAPWKPSTSGTRTGTATPVQALGRGLGQTSSRACTTAVG